MLTCHLGFYLLLILFCAIPRFILIYGIRVLSPFAESAFYPHLRNPLPESASAIPFRIPYSISAFYPNPQSAKVLPELQRFLVCRSQSCSTLFRLQLGSQNDKKCDNFDEFSIGYIDLKCNIYLLNFESTCNSK